MMQMLRHVRLIALREFQLLLLTPIFWVISGVFFFASSLVFTGLLIGFSNPEMRQQENISADVTISVVQQLFWVIHYFLMIQIPLLTMRSFAEERRARASQLMQTLPVSDWGQVLGKWLGSLAAFSLYLVLNLMFPAILHFLSEPSWLVIGGSFLALFLGCAAYLAIGLFFSSLTDSQVVAAVLSYVFLFGLMILASLAEAFSIGPLIEFSKHLTILPHIDPLLEGLLRVEDFTYFILLTGFFLFLTVRQLESQRWRNS